MTRNLNQAVILSFVNNIYYHFICITYTPPNIHMVVFTNWDDFHKTVMNLLKTSSRNCRIITKWQKNGCMTVRTTDDVHCFQFKTPSISSPEYNEEISTVTKGWEELQLVWIQENASKTL